MNALVTISRCEFIPCHFVVNVIKATYLELLQDTVRPMVSQFFSSHKRFDETTCNVSGRRMFYE